MPYRLLLALAVLLTSGAVSAQGAEPALELTATGTLVIATDGSVIEHQVDKQGLTPALLHLIDNNVRRWRFEPIRIDGRAVEAKTRMTLELAASPMPDGDFGVSLSNVWFGVPKGSEKNAPPRYPADAIRANLGARVLLTARLDEHGRVVEVHPYQTSLSRKARSDKEAAKWRTRFEKASIEAVMQWAYEPGELIDGKPIGNSVTIPISFTISSSSRGSIRGWSAFIPGPISPAPWLDTDRVAQIDTDALDDGEAGSLDSRFRLLSDVKGKAL